MKARKPDTPQSLRSTRTTFVVSPGAKVRVPLTPTYSASHEVPATSGAVRGRVVDRHRARPRRTQTDRQINIPISLPDQQIRRRRHRRFSNRSTTTRTDRDNTTAVHNRSIARAAEADREAPSRAARPPGHRSRPARSRPSAPARRSTCRCSPRSPSPPPPSHPGSRNQPSRRSWKPPQQGHPTAPAPRRSPAPLATTASRTYSPGVPAPTASPTIPTRVLAPAIVAFGRRGQIEREGSENPTRRSR